MVFLSSTRDTCPSPLTELITPVVYCAGYQLRSFSFNTLTFYSLLLFPSYIQIFFATLRRQAAVKQKHIPADRRRRRTFVIDYVFNPSKYEAQTAVFKDTVRTAL